MKRFILAALAVAFASSPAFAADRDFDLEVIASDTQGVLHYVRNHDSDLSAAIWSDGEDEDTARLITGGEADKAYRDALDAADLTPMEAEDLRIKLFGISVYASDDEGEDKGTARVIVNTPGDKKVTVDARDDGEDKGTTHVVITGADEDGARDFIDDIDEAPRKLKRDMKDAVGL